ncbi:MAG: heme-copper oxidase subunit III [Deltaproteobacteria bacterium]|nr:heme-copper oxidase subunit III [Deltaproteobacteria bacterium]
MSSENKSGKVGMILFLAAETMFFAGLVSAYLILRAKFSNWPPLGQPRLPVYSTGINTAFLLLSAFTFQRGVKNSDRNWISITFILGTLFLVLQGTEWVKLLSFGLTGDQNIYAGSFYLIIGAHGAHVLAALVFLLILALQAGKIDPARLTLRLEAARYYWFFVVGIWPVLYFLVYIL